MVTVERSSLPPRRRSTASTVRTVLLVLLVVVVVLTGLPVMVGGMSMEPCPDCGPVALACSSSCAILPIATLVTIGGLLLLLAAAPRRRAGLEFAWSIDPPPRGA